MRRTLIPEEKLRPKKEGAPWAADTTRLLNMFFMGLSPSNIAVQMSRSPKSINRHLERFYDNEEGKCDDYEPGKNRIWRGGERLTENDREMIRRMRRKGVSKKQMAKVLQRPVEELSK